MKNLKKYFFITLLFVSILHSEEKKALRFLVMGDPQFGLKVPGDFESGFIWSSSLWEKMPEICKKLNVKYFFICGDIFGLETAGKSKTGKDVCNESYKIFYDEWEKYLKKFEGICKVFWIVGGHEFAYCKEKGETYWDNSSRDYFLKNYSDKIRYFIIDDENLFILFDKTHDWDYLSQGGFKSNDSLIWLENILEKYKDLKYKWFFGHVPPRNITEWWPDREILKEDKNIKMAKLLEKYKITSAFFGHEHDEYFLGDRGGFPMFVTGMRYPLLVEVNNEEINYSWIIDTTNLKAFLNAFNLPAINLWKIAVIKNNEIISKETENIEPDLFKDLDFKFVKVDRSGFINLEEFFDLKVGDKLIAISEFKSVYYKGCHLMIKSSLPFSIWINGKLLEKNKEGDDKYHFYSSYSIRLNEDKNFIILLLEVKREKNYFAVFRDFSVNVFYKFSKELQN
ncbi:MAG: metallophosphoesterase family protein [Candidatus Ratteibacteria bacterium]